MTARELYDHVCSVNETAAQISLMSDASLAMLIRDIASSQAGIPALVLGLCEAEASKRWMESNTDRAGAVGEGGL